MKKYTILALCLSLTACANYCHKDTCQKKPAPEPQPVVYEQPAVEINSCACDYAPSPCREVLHPRVTQEIPFEPMPKPCEQHQFLNCGCGNCDTFHPQMPHMINEPSVPENMFVPAPKPAQYIPAQPKSYELAANRAFNRFIKDTYGTYSKAPNVKIYVEAPIAKDADLPGGIEKGTETFKMHLKNAHAFKLTDNIADADYIIKTTAEWFDTESKPVPAIRYVVELLSKDGKQAGIWSQIVKRADNKSWL